MGKWDALSGVHTKAGALLVNQSPAAAAVCNSPSTLPGVNSSLLHFEQQTSQSLQTSSVQSHLRTEPLLTSPQTQRHSGALTPER